MKATVLQTEMLFSDFLLLFIFIGGGGGGCVWEGGEFCEPQEFFVWLSNSLYEFILGHSMNIF